MSKKCLQGVLAIEFFDDANNRAKNILDQEQMIALNKQLSKELINILPKLQESSYAVLGALYQSNELLQPGFGIHGQLRQYLNASLKGENNKRNQLIIGANDKKLPDGFNLPAANTASPMLYLPFVIVTDITETQDYFEQELMHKGMGSVELLKESQTAFSAKIRHTNFMTVLDLAAMMHNHLQAAGFEPLWTLLEQALFNPQPEINIKTEVGNEFYLSKKIVFSPYFSMNYWQNTLNRDQQDYYPWLYLQRQYQAALTEHGLDLRLFIPETWPIDDKHICFASLDKLAIKDGYFHEVITSINKETKPTITNITHKDLGLISFKTTDATDGEEYYYPISSNGITKIQRLLSE